MIALGGGWDEALKELFDDPRYLKIREFLKTEYSTHVVYPDMYDLYNCFRYTPIDEVKAVILGQVGIIEPDCGDLTKWAKRGVLLLNTTLTVREHQANSHSKCGWAWFTDNVIRIISDRCRNVVFILWGANARSKAPLIDESKHLILQCAHPSPLSAYNGFFGCRFFSKTNYYLAAHDRQPIDWDLN